MNHIVARYLPLFTMVLATGCLGPKLRGTFDGTTYVSAQRDYSVPMPAMAGGDRIVGDDERGVTFQDGFGSRVSFYSLPFTRSSGIGASLQSGGIENALKGTFKAFGIESAAMHYHPEIRGGSLSCIYLKPPERTKTSVAAFIHTDHVYLVEVGLPAATRVLSKHDDEAALREQDVWLENRAVMLLQTMQVK